MEPIREPITTDTYVIGSGCLFFYLDDVTQIVVPENMTDASLGELKALFR